MVGERVKLVAGHLGLIGAGHLARTRNDKVRFDPEPSQNLERTDAVNDSCGASDTDDQTARSAPLIHASDFPNSDGAQRLGSPSKNCARTKCSFRWKGTVQSKIVLVVVPLAVTRGS